MKKHGEEDLNITTIGSLKSIDDVRLDKNENPYIYLKLLSIPQSIYDKTTKNEEKIQVYLSAFKEENFDEIICPSEYYKEEIFNRLSKKLISTKLQVKYFESDTEILRGQNARIIGNLDDNYYSRIPVFSPENTNDKIKNNKDFEANLIENKSLGFSSESWSKSEKDIPEYIIWKNENESFIYKIEQHNDIQFQYDNLDRIEINPLDVFPEKISIDWINSKYKTDDIIFVPVNILANIDFKKTFEKKYIDNLINEKNITNSDELSIDNSKIYNQQDNKELNFIKRFKDITRKNGLYYSEQDLVNFHTAMKSDGLVILAGLSGTGKSKLVSSYAKSLDPKSDLDDKLNFISVRPFWNDDSDLLGYIDTMNSVYRPGESGILESLMSANRNPESLYTIVFDEMNLSKVEHYFSQFLSVMERDENHRFLKLYNKSIEQRVFNKEQYPSSIKIPNNVKFVGTINTDESTNDFSDKVLDRSNMISLDLIPFYEVGINSDESEIVEEYDNDPITTKILTSMIGKSEFRLNDDDLQFLWDLHKLLYEINKNIGIGWRIIKQINNYISNVPNDSIINKNIAIDLQIAQRIMPKIKGSESQLEDILRTDADNPGSIIILLNKYNTISSFEKTKKIVSQKFKELKDYGFTI